MISTDIIIMVVLVIFVIIFLNINFKNAKKINQTESEKKLKEIEAATKVTEANADKPVEKPDDNYLHKYFNDESVKKYKFDDLEFDEVSETEIKGKPASVGEIKKFVPEIEEGLDELYATSQIVKQLDDEVDMSDDYEEDYAISDDDDETEFKNALSEEFKHLSPAMKAFIMANVLKPKDDKKDE